MVKRLRHVVGMSRQFLACPTPFLSMLQLPDNILPGTVRLGRTAYADKICSYVSVPGFGLEVHPTNRKWMESGEKDEKGPWRKGDSMSIRI